MPGSDRAGGPETGQGQLVDGNLRAVAIGSICTDDGVEVDEPPGLELGHSAERDAGHGSGSGLGHVEHGGELAPEVDDRPVPELGSHGVVEDGRFVVVPVRTQRRSDRRVTVSMGERTAGGAAMTARARPSRPARCLGIRGAEAVDRTEAWSSEGEEDRWVLGDGRGYALPPNESGPDEVPGVTPVPVGARWTLALTSRSARFQQHAVGELSRREAHSTLSTAPFGDDAPNPDRMATPVAAPPLLDEVVPSSRAHSGKHCFDYDSVGLVHDRKDEPPGGPCQA